MIDMGDIGSASFERVKDAILKGRAAALAAVNLRGLERANPDFVGQTLGLQAGDVVDSRQIAQRLNAVFALSDFERVAYTLSGDPGQSTLDVHLLEKSWGPHIFRFDLGFYTGTAEDTAFTIGADYLRTWVNDRGGELGGSLRLGRTSGLKTSFYQPLDAAHRWFVEPGLIAQRSIEDLYDDGDAVTRYRFSSAWGQLDAGHVFGTRAELRLGVRSGVQSATREIGSRDLPDIPAEGYGNRRAAVGSQRRVPAGERRVVVRYLPTPVRQIQSRRSGQPARAQHRRTARDVILERADVLPVADRGHQLRVRPVALRRPDVYRRGHERPHRLRPRAADLFRGIRAGRPHAARPVVAVTCRDQHQRLAAGARAGATDRGTHDQRPELVSARPRRAGNSHRPPKRYIAPTLTLNTSLSWNLTSESSLPQRMLPTACQRPLAAGSR